MKFKDFAKKLKTVIGGASNTKEFTKTIFETMMNDSGPDLLASISPNTFKSYYNGKTSILKVSALVLANLNDEYEFSSYLEGFGDTTAQLLADEFIDDIPEINAANASEKITELFLEILREASGKKKSTPKSATKNNIKTPHNTLAERILESGQSMANTFEAAISNLATSTSSPGSDAVEIPEEHPTNEFPYSAPDKLLLQEFNSDYDEIMITMIGENYAASLVDMILPSKIQTLYTTKWCEKANSFLSPTLKSQIFGLLGELNNLSDSFLCDNCSLPSIKNTRTKIRNLYVKLHPESFDGKFPYDAFIDDWNDGEY